VENAEPAKLDALTSLHRVLHRIEDRFHRLFRLHLGDVCGSGHLVDDVHLYHIDLRRDRV
jgi:hypothetical protein